MKQLPVLVAASATLLSVVALASRIDIVSEDHAAESWAQAPGTPRIVAGYPTAAADKSADACVNIGYLIGKDGSTSQFTEMRSWISGAPEGERPETITPYVQTAAATVSMWKFAPVGGKPHSIYTSATFVFDGSQGETGESIRKRCHIDDLPAFVAAAARREGDASRNRAYRDEAERDRLRMQGSNSR